MNFARRSLLTGVTGLLGAGCTQGPVPWCATEGLGPGLLYCLVQPKRIFVAGAARLAISEVALMAIDDSTAAIVARDDRGLYARSATCTHQCCTVAICGDDACVAPLVSANDCQPPTRGKPAPSSAAFICPCHGSLFALDGSVLRGPALVALPAVGLALSGDDAVVDLSEPASPGARLQPT